ncbi:NUP153 [Lepeophtheirus salmonis]|uniref:NUP153 n=1 Tax=Lepeophtheirus salmonis TaxID=72036 RepID=A0A7R8D4I3_LEPSM|nr:NUP153 [Lepeophtheirus salmonis]CAF3025814.1 NUP153 [Lepeophtheirus salmonis]
MENGHESQNSLSTFGTPIANSTRSLLSPRPGSSSSNHSTGSSSVSSTHRPLMQRLKGQDLYGGTVKFGGGNASTFFRQRRERLMAASPYASKKRMNDSLSRKASSPANEEMPDSQKKSNSIAPADAMSSTAKLILDTLERMSTPLRDARKIPVIPSDISRAEKRRLIAQELDSSLLGGGLRRKRPNLSSNGSSLNGPPVRTIFSPVLNRTKKSERATISENSNAKLELNKNEVKKTEAPKESIQNGFKPNNDADSVVSSIEAFKKTVDHSIGYGTSSAGGKLRMKDTAGPRSGRILQQPAIPVKTPVYESKYLPPNGCTKTPPLVEEKKKSTPTYDSPSLDLESTRLFTFSEPKTSSFVVDHVNDEKIIQYTFSNPRILTEESTSNSVKSPLLINGHEPNRKLPDVTSFPSATSLKSGSVLDVLVGSKGMLPDITQPLAN